VRSVKHSLLESLVVMIYELSPERLVGMNQSEMKTHSRWRILIEQSVSVDGIEEVPA
jgi:hypothetical protein